MIDLANIKHLYHGSAEPPGSFIGVPRPGGYDGVFWTAEHSEIAQLYIPVSGGCTSLYFIKSELDELVRPSEWSVEYALACLCGPAAKNIKYDMLGRASSWGIPEGYARKRDVVEFALQLGYRNKATVDGDVSFDIRTDGIDSDLKQPRVLPAHHRNEGSLVVVSGFERMKMAMIANGESDLMDLQYHRCDTFRRLEAAGYDGVIIDDFAQSKTHGNIGHLAIGFFKPACTQLETHVLSARRYEFSESGADPMHGTPELLAWQRGRLAQLAIKDSIRKSTLRP